MIKRILATSLVVSFVIPLFLSSCKVQSTPAGQETFPLSRPEAVTEKTAKSAWELEWDKNLQATKKERKIVLYTGFPPPLRQAIVDAFQKKTGIEVETVAGRGNEVEAKILAERRAGLFMADVYLGGTTGPITILKPSGVLKPIQPELFLPEVLDTKLWYKGQIPFMDKETLIIQYRYRAGGSQMDVMFDPKKVNKTEMVSWQDLLNPKFKGKMNLQDPMTPGKGSKFVNKALTYFGLDWDYMRALAKQDPVLLRDLRLQIEWVVQGKHLLAVNPDSVMFDDFQRAGSSIDSTVFRETVTILGGGFGGMSLLKDPPHPNAQKIFVNWFLSKEGMLVYSKAYEVQTAREDLPLDHLPQNQLRDPKINYPVETEEFILQEPKMMPMITEVFSPLLK